MHRFQLQHRPSGNEERRGTTRGSIDGQAASGRALDEACNRDRVNRQRRVRVLGWWVTFGHGAEVIGVYLTALGLTVLVADFVFGGMQLVHAALANAERSLGQRGPVPYLPMGQVSGLLWLAGLPLWGLGSLLRRNSTLWRNRHASRGEEAGPLNSRYALRFPSWPRFGRCSRRGPLRPGSRSGSPPIPIPRPRRGRR